jgi:uncharacterized protein with FMN-binding domain
LVNFRKKIKTKLKITNQILISAILLVSIGTLFPSCKIASIIGEPVNYGKLVDGVYEGSYARCPNKAVVKVTIKDQKIADVQIVQHWAWKGKKAETPVINRIVEHQSTKVDAVSGATNSSHFTYTVVSIHFKQ